VLKCVTVNERVYSQYFTLSTKSTMASSPKKKQTTNTSHSLGRKQRVPNSSREYVNLQQPVWPMSNGSSNNSLFLLQHILNLFASAEGLTNGQSGGSLAIPSSQSHFPVPNSSRIVQPTMNSPKHSAGWKAVIHGNGKKSPRSSLKPSSPVTLTNQQGPSAISQVSQTHGSSMNLKSPVSVKQNRPSPIEAGPVPQTTTFAVSPTGSKLRSPTVKEQRSLPSIEQAPQPSSPVSTVSLVMKNVNCGALKRRKSMSVIDMIDMVGDVDKAFREYKTEPRVVYVPMPCKCDCHERRNSNASDVIPPVETIKVDTEPFDHISITSEPEEPLIPSRSNDKLLMRIKHLLTPKKKENLLGMWQSKNDMPSVFPSKHVPDHKWQVVNLDDGDVECSFVPVQAVHPEMGGPSNVPTNAYASDEARPRKVLKLSGKMGSKGLPYVDYELFAHLKSLNYGQGTSATTHAKLAREANSYWKKFRVNQYDPILLLEVSSWTVLAALLPTESELAQCKTLADREVVKDIRKVYRAKSQGKMRITNGFFRRVCGAPHHEELDLDSNK